MRISAAQRQANENQIRTAMDRILRGEIPAGGRCDVKTLAREAGVDPSAFYGKRPYAHLRADFERRLQLLEHTGEVPDQREAQIAHLKNEIAALKQRLTGLEGTIGELHDFRSKALAPLAAEHHEITRLRDSLAAAGQVSRLPSRGAPGTSRRAAR